MAPLTFCWGSELDMFALEQRALNQGKCGGPVLEHDQGNAGVLPVRALSQDGKI